MSEADEIAAVLAQGAPRFASMDEARRYVREQMFDKETEQVIDNIAWSLYRSQQRDA